jgi:hypothetical protein
MKRKVTKNKKKRQRTAEKKKKAACYKYHHAEMQDHETVKKRVGKAYQTSQKSQKGWKHFR